MRQGILLSMLFLVGGCSHPGNNYARDFVYWDARSDAENTASERCQGRYKLIAGAKGLVADDYKCLPEPTINPGPAPN